MENFVVSARKYRPQIFEDLVGQQVISNTLKNAIKNNHLAQALLFTGPRGVGKTSCARILAKKINDEEGIYPDEDFAFNIFELDAASNNSVDDIRALIDQVRIPPQIGKCKVYIIDEVHMLSQSAFNAFLKTLEEPPAHIIFILATTQKHKIIPTILSRCQIFDFKRIGVLDAKNHLKKIADKEGIKADDDALHIISQKADGAMRDALSIFDRVVSFCGDKMTKEAVTENLNVLDYDVYFKITDMVLKNKIPQVLIEFNNILSRGFEGHHFINGLASHFRDLLVAKDVETISLLEVGDSAKKKYLKQSSETPVSFLMQAIEKSNECDLKYKSSKNQRLLLEITLMQIASITFEAEKKNDSYIIPASFFKSQTVKEKPTPDKDNIRKTVSKHTGTISPEKKDVSTSESKEKSNRPSALSLKSVNQKLELEPTAIDAKIDRNSYPKDHFSENDILDLWNNYGKQLLEEGNKNLSSILKVSNPLINDFTIQYTVPNKLMKEELENFKPKLLKYIRESLNNFSIDLLIEVNEKEVKKIAYDPQEKYDVLRKANPDIEFLKTIFKLDIQIQ